MLSMKNVNKLFINTRYTERKRKRKDRTNSLFFFIGGNLKTKITAIQN